MKKTLLIAMAAVIAASCETLQREEIIDTTEQTPAGNTGTTEVTPDNPDTGTVDPFNPSDSLSNTTVEYTVNVVYSGGSATVTGATDQVTVTWSGADVTITNTGEGVIRYVLSGSCSNGFFKLYSERKQVIELSGLSLTCTRGAAINNQSHKRTFIVLTGTNSLADGTSYTLTPEGEDEKAAFFSEGQLCFSGEGSLTVTARGKAAITSDDYVRFLGGTVSVSSGAGHGIRGKEAVIVSAGTVTASSSADMKKAVSSDGFYQQDGGSVTLTSTGNAAFDSEDNDVTGAACIKVDGDFIMNDGTLTATATGKGGKAISGDGTGFFRGGTITAKASGSNFSSGSYTSKAKAVKFDGNVEVSGGVTFASSSAHEAATTDKVWLQSGGIFIATGADDAINAATGITVTGGFMRGTSSGNDGIDANAAIAISGGVVIGEGASGAECGIDSVEGTYVTVDGGYVISRGGRTNPFNTTSGKAFVTTTAASGARIGIADGSTQLLGYQAPSGGGTTLLISTPEMKSGSSYTLYTGVSSLSLPAESLESLGITFADSGLDAGSIPDRFGTAFTGGSSSGSLTASSSAGNSGPGGGGPGGGGGWPGGGGGRH